MKKIMFFMMLVASVAVLTCCSAEDPIEELYGNQNNGNTNNPNNGSSDPEITVDNNTAEPVNVVGEYLPDEEDALENNNFTTLVNIDLSNPAAMTENGVTVTVNGGHVKADHGETKGICYVLSGATSNGSFTVVGEKKYEVKLNGVSITNPDSAALNLLSGKRAYVVLADGTTNTLEDGKGGSHKGALYCKGKLLFNGSGTLNVTGNTKNGIHTADYVVFRTGNNISVKSTAKHGIKANDGVFINGGVLNIETTAQDAKGINCESHIIVNGGRTTVQSKSYEGEGIQADSTMTIAGGELTCIAYDDAINTKGNMTISGGYVYAQGLHNDGLDANGNLYIKGGLVYAICSGTPEVAIDANTEGGYKLYLSGGTVIAVGGLENGSSLTQSCYQTSQWQGSTWYTLTCGSDTFSFKTPSSGGSGLVVSTASTPTLKMGTSVSGGTSCFCGLAWIGGTASEGSAVSLSSYTGGSGFGPGGGGPRWGW